MLSGLPFFRRPEKHNRQRTRRQQRERQRRLLLEMLEDRRLLAIRTWDGGGGDDDWSTPENWDGDLSAPVAGDALDFAGTTRLSPVNDFPADTSFAGITFNSGAGAFTLSGNRITLTGNVTNNDNSLQTINLDMILSGTRTFTNATGGLAVGGVLSDAGGLIKSGTGTLTLSGANTYSGSTTVSNGTLKLGASGVIPDGVGVGDVTVAAAGTSIGTLDLAGHDETINGLTGNGFVDNTVGGTSTLTVGAADATSSFPGVIRNTSGTVNLTKTGTGMFTLSGVNSYGGMTNIEQGTLSITDQNSLGTSAGATVVSDGATLNLSIANNTINESLELNGPGVANGGALTATGTPTIGLVPGPTASVTLATDARMGVANGATLTLRAQVTGSGGLTKVGAGILTLNNGSNDYLGNTVISVGKLQVRDTSDVIPHGPGKGNVTVEANGVLELIGGSESINGLSGSGTIDNTGLLGRTLTAGFNDQTSTFSGIIQNTQGPLSLTKQGTGTLTLSGANTYSGDTTISNGTLQLGASEVIPHGTGKGDVVMNGGGSVAGILDLNGFDETINGLDGSSAAVLGQVINSVSTANTLTVGANDDTETFAGLIKNNLGSGGTVALTKTGGGVQTLSGNNTYTGPTAVNAGTLLVNGSTAAGSGVTVNSGGTLGGTGTIYGGVSVQANGTTSPGLAGTARGVLNYAGGLTIASNGNLNINLAPLATGNVAGTRYDQANVSGGTSPNVNIADANLNITASGTNPNGVEQLMIVQNDGDYLTDPVNGKFAGNLDGFRVQVSPYDGYLSYFDGDGNDITLTTKNNAATVVDGTPGADSFTLRRVENTVQVLLGTAVHGAWPYDSLTSLTINGLGAADTLTVQLSADGNPVPTGGVTFNGGAGNDTLDLSAYTAAMSGAVAGLGTADGLRGTASVPSLASFTFDNLEVLTGGTASGDTLTGANLASAWNLDSTQTYVSTRTLTFSGFETLQGGTAADAFNISVPTAADLKGGGAADTFTFAADAGSLTGSIDGETGTNTLSYSGFTNAIDVSVSLPAGSATRVTLGISNIQNVTGGAGNDTIVGDANANVLIGGAGDDALTDGAGNDTLTGGLGNDTFYLVPGSEDIVNDTGGSDTVNFIAATAAVTIDMDSTSQQTIDLSGNKVTLTGTIENFVGSAFNDTVSVDALASNVTRSMSGGGLAGDVLTVDAKLQAVTDNGAQLSFSGGYGAITYGTFETLHLIATDVTVEGGSTADTLVVTATGTQAGKYQLNTGPEVNFSNLAKLTFNAGDGNDTLIINNPAGSFFAPSSGVIYTGGGQTSTPGDTLQILGGTVTELRFDYTDLHDGSVYYNGNPVISYTGLEPIASTVDAANVLLNYSTTAETITVTSVSASQTKAASTAGEETTFNNPSTLLRINAGDTNSDTINVASISSGFSANLTVDGQGGAADQVNFDGAIDIHSGLLTIQNAETIDVNQNLTALGGMTFSSPTTTYLGASLQTDGTDVAITGGTVVIDAAAVTIDTESDSSGNAGNVALGGTTIRADAAGRDLSINTSAPGIGGNVTLGTLTDGGAAYVDDLSIDANGSTRGNVNLNGTIRTGGSILIANAATVDVNQNLTAGASLTMQNAAGVTIDASAARTLTSLGGDISIATSVTQITLDGGSALVTLDANGVETDTTDADALLAAVNTVNPATAPSLTVTADGGVAFSTIDLNGSSTDGSLSLTVDANDNGTETLTINGGITNVASLTLSGGGTGTDDTIDVNADLTTTAGALTIQNAASVTIDATVLRTLTSQGGDIRIVSNVAQVTLDGGSALVTLDANGVESDATEADVTLAAVTATGNPDLTVNSEGDIGLASVNLGAVGDLSVHVDNNANGSQAGTFGALTAGTVQVTGTGANDALTFSGTVTSHEAAGVTAGAGTIDFYAPVVTTTGAGLVAVTGQNAVVFHAGSGIDAGGTVTVAANQDSAGAEGFTQASGTTIQTANTGVNAIRLTVNMAVGGTGNASIAALQTGTGGTATIDARGGAIVDNNAAAVNVTAGQATLSAAAGIGSGDALETNIATLDAENTGTGGHIRIEELAAGGDLGVLRSAQTGGSGNIEVSTADGTLTVLSGGSGVTTGGGGNISLTANGSGQDVILNHVVTAQGGTVTVHAHGGDGSHLAVNAAVTTAGGAIQLQADQDITGNAGGHVSSGAGGGHVTLHADFDAIGSPDDAGTIQLEGNITGGTGDLTFILTDCDGWINGNILSGGNLAKNGTGTLRLNGNANTYTGTTTVNGGYLLINGVLNQTTVSIFGSNGGTLGGTGTIVATTVTVNATGRVDPGDLVNCLPQPGLLTVDGNVKFNQGATFNIQLYGTIAATGYDQLRVNGTVDLSGTVAGVGGSLLSGTATAIPIGAELRIIDNNDIDEIGTRFNGLKEGDFVTTFGPLMNISYYAGTGNDVVLTTPGRFDFNGFHGYTAPTWIGVSPFQSKTNSYFGWQTLPTQYFERSYPVPAPYTTGDEKLKYDGQSTDNTNAPLTFLVDVEAGKTYEVMILTGDMAWNHDREKFTVTGSGGTTTWQQVDTWGAGPPDNSGVKVNWGGGVPNPGPGYYRWVHLTTTVGGPLGTTGSLSMTMQDLGGWDGAAVILAMDVRPVATVGRITLTPLAALPADGVAWDTYTGSKAPPDTVLTVTGFAPNMLALPADNSHYVNIEGVYPAPTPPAADLDLTSFGTQIRSDAGGNFSFRAMRPSLVTPVTFTVQETTGLSRGTMTQTYVAPPDANALRFDFGIFGSPVQTDFLQVIPQTTYSATRGYGWMSRVAGANRKDPTMSNLRTDLNYAANATFKVDLPTGNYSVRIYHSNPKYYGTTPYLADNFNVYAEGSSTPQYNVVNIAPGTTDIRQFTVAVSGGALELQFRDMGGRDGNFVVSGIEISAGTLPGEAPLLAVGDPRDAGAAAIGPDLLQPVVAEAAARWSDIGLTPAQAATLANVQFAVADLGGAYLGLANPATNTIRIDDDAAMLGWSLGKYEVGSVKVEGIAVSPFSLLPSNFGVDLLTVVMHEMGHLLGYGHTDDDHDLMTPVLAASPRHPAALSDSLSPHLSLNLSLNLSSSALRPGSPADVVFADLGENAGSMDSSAEAAADLLDSPHAWFPDAGPAKSGDEAAQARVPRRSRMQRFERELDDWFAELAGAEETVNGQR